MGRWEGACPNQPGLNLSLVVVDGLNQKGGKLPDAITESAALEAKAVPAAVLDNDSGARNINRPRRE